VKKVKSDNRTLIIDEKQFELEYRIKDVRIIDDLAVVIYDFDENAPRHKQFQNCQAFDNNGDLIWIAEHPTNTSSDFYVEFMKGRENKLWNFGCFICELNFKNGKLINSDFTK